MSFDTSIAESIQSQTAKLVELVSDETSSQAQTAYEVESQLWQSLLVMGQHLMQLFFNKQEEAEERHISYEVDGVTYGYRGQRKRQYVSLFGEVALQRAGIHYDKLTFDVEGHGIERKPNKIVLYQTIVEFFKKALSN